MLIIGIIVLVVVTAVVITIPLTQKDMSAEEPAYVDLDLAKLEEEKEAAYNALKEAEFDYETGKLSDEDYKAIKDKYSARAVAAIKRLEEYQGTKVGSAKWEAERETGTVPTPVEGETSSKTDANFCSSCGSKIENGAKFCGACGRQQIKAKANTCPNCGSEHRKGAKFCASCGQRLN